MKTFAITRPTSYIERERPEGEFLGDRAVVTSCPTQADAEKLLKAIEKHSFMRYLTIDERN